MVFIELVYNLTILVSLSVVSAFLEDRFDRTSRSGQVLQGILFGIIALIGMLKPLRLGEGLIFDGRTVVLSLCALFFGPLAGGLSALIPAIYRIHLGGPGMAMGIATILSSVQIGALFHYWYVSSEKLQFSKRHLLNLGILVHAAMLLKTLLLPGDLALQTLRAIGPTVAIAYPIATILIGKILLDQIEKRQYLRSLRDAAERYRTTLESIGDGVITTDQLGVVDFLNPVAEKLTGWKNSEAFGNPIEFAFPIINEETRQKVENPVAKVLREGSIVGLANHTLLISRDGREIPIADSGAPILTPEREIRGVVLVFRDQSAERAYVSQLSESERRYRNLFTSTNDGIALHELIVSLDGVPVDYRVLDVNRNFEQILGLKRGEVVGKLSTEVYKQENAPYLEIYAQTACTGKPCAFDIFYAPMQRHLHISVFSPGPNQFATVFQDITERKIASDRLAKELEENKLLLREVHHRVKNNLQVILSLIQLRVRKQNVRETSQELAELESRVLTMSRAHDLLYDSKDFRHIELKRYIWDILNSFRFKDTKNIDRIQLKAEINDILVDIDTALILGHIVTELVSNVYKHAFPDNRTGVVKVLVDSLPEGILLEIADTGVGLPPGTSIEEIANTGIEIVLGFVKQTAGGCLTCESTDGLRIRIVIPAPLNR